MITWGMVPLLIKINTITGAACFFLCCIPKLLNWPKILLPAFVFFESVLVLLVWGLMQ